jgi:hypothetical protein
MVQRAQDRLAHVGVDDPAAAVRGRLARILSARQLPMPAASPPPKSGQKKAPPAHPESPTKGKKKTARGAPQPT